jgi:uncharacterized protein
MLFQGIENLLGGHHGGNFLGGQAPIAGAPEIVENTTVIDEYQGADYRVGSDNGFLGSRDPGDVGGPAGGPDPFAGMDPFADSGIDGDPSDWA